MKTVQIFGANRFKTSTKTREACRGLVTVEGRLLLTYEVHTDQWFIPGGGMEPGETREECCIRELGEETGILVKPDFPFLTIEEYYEEWKYISHYYLCEITGKTERKLTEREKEVGLEPRWLPLEEALEIFSKHNEYTATDEMKRGGYLREYEALSYFVKERL